MSLFRPFTITMIAGSYKEWEGVEGFEPSTWNSAGSHSFRTELNAQNYFSENYLKFGMLNVIQVPRDVQQ